MDDEIHVISDGDGLAVVGETGAVERFLASTGLPTKDLGLHRLRSSLVGAAALAQAGSEIAANSGRWMKLTEESARLASSLPMVVNSKTGNLQAVLRAENGQFVKNLEFVGGRGVLLASPAGLAAAAALMAQLAIQQAMEEITDYLAVIDTKIDDVLRAQNDAVLADMIGVDFVIEEAMTIREKVGGVSEVTWSKVQGTSLTIARTQAYALRRLDALAEKMERETHLADLAKVSKEARSSARDWLAILARCFQLQDGIALLELDRVLDTSADEVDRHRLALRVARQDRLELIGRSTQQLLARMDSAARRANAKVLLQPIPSRAVVDSTNHVALCISDFHQRLGILDGRKSLEAKRWAAAVAEVKDRVLLTGAEGVEAAGQLGGRALHQAHSTKGKLSTGIKAFRQAMKDQDE